VVLGTDGIGRLVLDAVPLHHRRGGHWLLIKTYDVAEASQVQPFAYFQLVFAAGLGMLVFGETLEWNVARARIVVAAGVFTLWRARVAES
jgi:drug/metabolite transporter (DMT)-like permease